MRSNLDDATRRRILADIGIDVWRLRMGATAAFDAIESRSDDRSDVRPDMVSGPRLSAEPASGGAVPRPRSGPLAEGTAPASDQPESRSGDRSRGEARPTPESIEPFSVLSFAADGVMLLLERVPTAREQQLARDLVAAATGSWDGEPALRRFDWPPAVTLPGAGDPGAADRALRAFVAKEFADHGCTLVLLAEALATRLGELRQAGERLLIPDLAVLGRDPAEKRRVWTALSRYRRAEKGRTTPGAGVDAGPPSGAAPGSGSA